MLPEIKGQSWSGFGTPTGYSHTYLLGSGDTINYSQTYFEDFNGDGMVDFLLDGGIYGQSQTGEYLPNFSIYTNLGNGQFSAENVFPSGSTHRVVTDAADFNNDGFPDLLVADFWGNGFWLRPGQAGLKFGAGTFYPTSTHGGMSGFCDLDQDGDLDVVSVAAGSGSPVKVFVYTNVNGVLSAPDIYPYTLQQGTFYYDLRFEDFNIDGNTDIYVLARNGYTLEPLILLQQSTMVFNATHQMLLGASISHEFVNVQDLNADGFPDMVYVDHMYLSAANPNPMGNLHIWNGNATATYTGTPTTGDSVLKPYSELFFTDVNNDGLEDMIYYSMYYLIPPNWHVGIPNEIQIYLQNTQGQFTHHTSIPMTMGTLTSYGGVGGIALEDVNADGFDDLLAITEKDVQIFLNLGNQVSVEESAKANWNFYPNPASETVRIITEEPIENIRLLNSKGQELEVKFQSNTLNIQGLPPGVYWVGALNTHGAISWRKLIVE
ncbi:MAG: hypothetical protein SchgKO_05580 [Schleiferiaceae bacterium]